METLLSMTVFAWNMSFFTNLKSIGIPRFASFSKGSFYDAAASRYASRMVTHLAVIPDGNRRWAQARQCSSREVGMLPASTKSV